MTPRKPKEQLWGPAERVSTAAKLACGIAGKLVTMVVRRKLSRQVLSEVEVDVEELHSLIRNTLFDLEAGR